MEIAGRSRRRTPGLPFRCYMVDRPCRKERRRGEVRTKVTRAEIARADYTKAAAERLVDIMLLMRSSTHLVKPVEGPLNRVPLRDSPAALALVANARAVVQF